VNLDRAAPWIDELSHPQFRGWYVHEKRAVEDEYALFAV
jgi:hypothetical protein